MEGSQTGGEIGEEETGGEIGEETGGGGEMGEGE